ncbi:MAG TPA: hypothetical protein ENG03_09440 [Thioploca sp.]|nr:hypothetical protein [Thioploca sp.]
MDAVQLINDNLAKLPQNRQLEVLDFTEYLIFKKERQTDKDSRTTLSPLAMCDTEDEEATLYKDLTQAQPSLSELFDCVATDKERMTLTYRKKVFLAVVPIEDVEVVKQLSNCINDYTGSQLETICVDGALKKLLGRVATNKVRMILTYRKQVFLTVVPIEDFYLIEELEDCIDNADANDALKEAFKTGTISSEQLDKELGW